MVSAIADLILLEMLGMLGRGRYNRSLKSSLEISVERIIATNVPFLALWNAWGWELPVAFLDFSS